MSKSHRDNTKARKKIGQTAYNKKKERRSKPSRCAVCGCACRETKLFASVCPKCIDLQKGKSPR